LDKISVLLVDDHAIVREGTRELLEREPDITVVGEASNGEEALKLAQSANPKVVVMDMAMPGMNGLEATRLIKKCSPHTAVLVFSAYDDDPYVFAVLEAGAAGYLLKNARGAELVQAIRAVHSGESVLHPSVARKVLARMASKGRVDAHAASPGETLSDRELEVLGLAAKGMSNKEIAGALRISPRTVQVHLGNIFSKLQVGSRTEAVILGVKRGWISLE
jgi:DNA-binding NarL/FixJ family response regulator